MAAIEFRVRRTDDGWIVVSGETYGPLPTREKALDLAYGMVTAVRSSGREARVVIEDDPSPRARG